MHAKQILQVVETVLHSELAQGESYYQWVDDDRHWEADWKGGRLVLESGQPEEGDDDCQMRLIWHSPDPERSTRLVLRLVTGFDDIQSMCCDRQLLTQPTYTWAPVPLPGSVEINDGPRCLRGHYAPDPEELPGLAETGYRYDTPIGYVGGKCAQLLVCQLEAISTETHFYSCKTSFPPGRKSGCQIDQAPSVESIYLASSRLSGDELLQYFPNLRQCRIEGESAQYRHPDGRWSRDLPEDGLPYLWVHSIAEMPGLRQATEILIPASWLSPKMALSLAEQYTYQRRRGVYLLTRRPRAKSALSAQ